MYFNKSFYSCIILFMGFVHFKALAQNDNLGIGTSSPHSKAIVEIFSQDKGVLIPRLTEQERNNLQVPGSSNPSAIGLLIYNTKANKFNFWTGNDWEEVGWANAANTGTRWFYGAVIPASGASVTSSQDNDYYLNTTLGKVYKRESGQWREKISLLGQPGPNGVAGLQGAQGDTGSVWFNGADTPTTNNVPTARDGDHYLAFNSGDVYQKKQTWQKVTNIRGAQGQTGPIGPNGITGAQGNTGTIWYIDSDTPTANTAPGSKEKDYYISINGGNLYQKTAAGWPTTPLTSLKGLPGTPGAPGANGDTGTIWYSDAGTPTANSVTGSKNNDYYLDNTNGNLYKKTGNVWSSSPIFTLKGQPGLGGGLGSKWYNGTSPPATALLGDYFLNTNTQEISEYNGVTWASVTNIKGPAGSGGANGQAAVYTFLPTFNTSVIIVPSSQTGTRDSTTEVSLSVPGISVDDVVFVSPENGANFPKNIGIGAVSVIAKDQIKIKFVNYEQKPVSIPVGTRFIVGAIR